MSGKHRAPEAPSPSPGCVTTDSRGIVKIRHGKPVPPAVTYITPAYLEPKHPNNNLIADVIDINDEHIIARFSEWVDFGVCGGPVRRAFDYRAVVFEWRAYTLAELQGADQ